MLPLNPAVARNFSRSVNETLDGVAVRDDCNPTCPPLRDRYQLARPLRVVEPCLRLRSRKNDCRAFRSSNCASNLVDDSNPPHDGRCNTP
jgi:hypothetical protein